VQALSKFCCQNKKCPDYGKRNANNLSVCGRFGKNNHIRLLYCRTCKNRFSERKDRVVKIDLRAGFGSKAQVQAAIENSAVSNMINTSFVERHNGTDRNRNARKVRETYCFSKDPGLCRNG